LTHGERWIGIHRSVGTNYFEGIPMPVEVPRAPVNKRIEKVFKMESKMHSYNYTNFFWSNSLIRRMGTPVFPSKEPLDFNIVTLFKLSQVIWFAVILYWFSQSYGLFSLLIDALELGNWVVIISRIFLYPHDQLMVFFLKDVKL
jgi:hypothetical protein